MSKNTPADADKNKPFLIRLRAAAEQLTALASARTEAYRQAQLATIDWALVANELESVVGRYECSVERYAAKIIKNLSSLSISYRDCVALQLAVAGLEAHLGDFEPGHDFGDDIETAWEESIDTLDVARGLARRLDQISTLEQLRHAASEKLTLHRRLVRSSDAYHAGWPVLHKPKAVADLLRAAELSLDASVATLLTCGERKWESIAKVLVKMALALGYTVSDAVLAELSAAVSLARHDGLVETRGHIDLWHDSEIRLTASAKHMSASNTI